MQSVWQILIIVLIFTQAPGTALSKVQSPVQLIFGPEWTFTNPEILGILSFDQHVRPRYIAKVQSLLNELCTSGIACKFEKAAHGLPAGILEFPDGFQVHFRTDQGVFELQSTPLSLKDWQDREEVIRRTVFETMAKADLFPHEVEGGGHLNIGLKYFEHNPILLRNVIVDFYNHPGLGVVLNSLTSNARDAQALDQMELHRSNAFVQAVKAFDAIPNPTLIDLIQTIGRVLEYKYVGLGLRDVFDETTKGARRQPEISETSRLEIRTLRPQKSMKDYLKVLEIFESRIHLLEKVKFQIPLQNFKPIEDGHVALGQFADYLEKSGLKFDKFKSLLPSVWQEIPTEHFIRPHNSYDSEPNVRSLRCRSAHH